MSAPEVAAPEAPLDTDAGAAEGLTAAEVSRRLLAALGRPGGTGFLPASESDDAEGMEDVPPRRRAAVLVPVLLGEAPSILLTLRSAALSAHAGQVALPGGRIEAGETPEAAAVREAAEEVGLDPRLPEIVGRLPEHRTGTGFHITPVVALLTPPFSVTPDPSEVAEIFEYPIDRLLDPTFPERRSGVWSGRERHYWVWPHETQLIWGATAAILRNLALVLRAPCPR
ncbi:CoA pyrophosphatase [Roseomonas sp. BN140053]|uniref:CoA pyrophosphatase n=1 Tax=Roseomonas sp. BN140053 TaxID=3391898 RepID=UPI0039ECB6B6